MPPPYRPLTFGSFLFPKSSEGPGLLRQASLTEELGFDLIGVPDHADWGHYIDQWTLMSAIIGHTSRIEVAGAVTALALREPPFVLAKAALSLDNLAPGRFHFGLGTGALPGVVSIDGPQWAPAESVDRLREAIELTRLAWSGVSPASYAGRYYRFTEASLPPAPSPALDIWVGATKPRMRKLIAQAADGWIPGMYSIDPVPIAIEVDHLDAELEAAGRPVRPSGASTTPSPRRSSRRPMASLSVRRSNGSMSSRGLPSSSASTPSSSVIETRQSSTFTSSPSGSSRRCEPTSSQRAGAGPTRPSRVSRHESSR